MSKKYLTPSKTILNLEKTNLSIRRRMMNRPTDGHDLIGAFSFLHGSKMALVAIPAD